MGVALVASKNPCGPGGWTKAAYDRWFKSLPTRVAPDSTPRYKYQRKHTGPTERLASGGGKELWTDGIDGDTILEAKHIGNPDRSPYIDESDAPDYVRNNARAQVEDEVMRMSKIISDNSNPLKKARIITNHPSAADYFRRVLLKFGVEGDVVIKPE